MRRPAPEVKDDIADAHEHLPRPRQRDQEQDGGQRPKDGPQPSPPYPPEGQRKSLDEKEDVQDQLQVGRKQGARSPLVQTPQEVDDEGQENAGSRDFGKRHSVKAGKAGGRCA